MKSPQGQGRSGHLRSVSPNTRRSSGSTPAQSLRGFGGAPSRNSVVRGNASPQVQKQRGFRQTNSSPSTRNTSAGRIKKG